MSVLLEAIKKYVLNSVLTSDQENQLDALSTTVTNSQFQANQIQTLKNSSLAYVSKSSLCRENRIYTNTNTYQGSSIFSGQLTTTGTVNLVGSNVNIEGYTTASEVSGCEAISIENSVVTIPMVNSSGNNMKKLYHLSSQSDTELTVALTGAESLPSGQFRSYIFIIPTTSDTSKVITRLIVGESEAVDIPQNNMNTYSNPGFARYQLEIWNIGGDVQSSGVVQYFSLH